MHLPTEPTEPTHPGEPGEPGAIGLALDNVTVTHRDGAVGLDGVTLTVGSGELLAVVGASGSGKTTLLRAVAGLTEVTRGTVAIGGRDVTRLSTERRDVAMVFESGALVPFLDVAGNLGLGLRAQHLPTEEVRDRVSTGARHLRLTRLLPRKPEGLSAGERGRVGIGRAFVRIPTVWLLDEPLAHLDPAERAGLRHWLAREVRRLGVTTVYVTHDPAEALALGDRIAVLERGRLVQVGTPRIVYQQPASVFAADFMGTQQIGLLPARLVRSGGLAGFRVGTRTLPYWAPVPPPLEENVGGDVVLALRLEDVYDASTAQDAGFARVDATVLRTEFTGPDLLVTVEVDAPPVSCPGVNAADAAAPRARLCARFPPSAKLQVGSRVTVAIDATRVHVFDAVTGRALWHPPLDAADPD